MFMIAFPRGAIQIYRANPIASLEPREFQVDTTTLSGWVGGRDHRPASSVNWRASSLPRRGLGGAAFSGRSDSASLAWQRGRGHARGHRDRGGSWWWE